MEKSKSTSSGECDGGSKDKIEENTNTTAKFSVGSVSVGGEGHSSDTDNGKNSNEGSTERYDDRMGDNVQGAVGDFSTHMGRCATGKSESREMGFFPPSGIPPDLKEIKGFDDAFSLVGRQAQPEKEQMEVSSPIKFKAGLNEEKKKHTKAHGKRDSKENKGRGKLEKNCKGERKE